MLQWIANNVGSIIALVVLAVLVSAIIVKMVKDKKNGKASCSCGCEHCAMSSECHKK